MQKSNAEDRSLWLRVLACTMLFGLAAHGYRYVTLAYSHDSLMLYQAEAKWQISLGRFLEPVYLLARGKLCAPFLIGLLSLVWLSAAVYLTVKLLHLKKGYTMILLCGALTVNATLTLTNATYIQCSDMYMAALFFAVLGVYACVKWRFGFAFSAFFLCGSLGLYQSYFQVAAVLFLLLALRELLTGQSVRAVLRSGGKALLALGLGLAVYYGVYRLSLSVTGVEPAASYNGLSGAGDFSAVSIPELLGQLYRFTLEYWLFPESYNSVVVGVLNAALLALALAGMVRLSRRLPWQSCALLWLLVLLMPLAMNVVLFIAKGVRHTLMLYSLFFLYAFVLMVSELLFSSGDMPEPPIAAQEKTARRSLLWQRAVIAAFAVILFNNIVFSNQVYLKKELEYQATSALMNRVLDRMEQVEGYDPGVTPVAFIGVPMDSPLMVNRPGFAQLTGVGINGYSSISYYQTYQYYFDYQLGYPVELLPQEESEALAQLPKVQAMSAFPAKDSVQLVENVLIVKLK